MSRKNIRKELLLPAFLVFAFFLYYRFFLGPVRRDIRNDSRELSSLQKSADMVWKRDDLAARSSELKTRFRKIKAGLPKDLDSYDIIVMLSESDPGHMKKESLIFLEPIKKKDYIVLPVRFHFSTDYSGLTQLLSSLDSLSVRPSVSDMQISLIHPEEGNGDSIGTAGGANNPLDVEMTLNFYRKGDKASSDESKSVSVK
ncbi:MAG TPA: hypothetical protein DDW86_08170 [Clostridiales bacterium]|jgi:Tfp pilus assembly protein PilO|nr:hypothetical protein [Clostridiales bacterium]